jgi:hypothetical protein
VFFDVGRVRAREANLTTRRPDLQRLIEQILPGYQQTLASLGLGLEANWYDWQIQLTLARAMRDDLYKTRRGDWFGHGEVLWSF